MIHNVGTDFKVPLPIFCGRTEDCPVWSGGGRSADSADSGFADDD